MKAITECTADEIREKAACDLAKLDELDAQLTSLGKDAYRERDMQTVWFCGAQKRRNDKTRENIKAALSLLGTHRESD